MNVVFYYLKKRRSYLHWNHFEGPHEKSRNTLDPFGHFRFSCSSAFPTRRQRDSAFFILIFQHALLKFLPYK